MANLHQKFKNVIGPFTSIFFNIKVIQCLADSFAILHTQLPFGISDYKHHSTVCRAFHKAKKLIYTLYILTSTNHFLSNLHYENAKHQHRKRASPVAHFDDTKRNVIQEIQ